jgi:hypothetical protein
MDLYFKRHDGQAVTCEDFFAAMRDANDADFANFLQWYRPVFYFLRITLRFFMLTLECNKITGTPKLVHLW